MYNYFSESEFNSCDPDVNTDQAVCVPGENGGKVSGNVVLQEFSTVFPLLKDEDETAKDFGIILAVGAFFKLMYIAGVLMKTSQVSKFVQ